MIKRYGVSLDDTIVDKAKKKMEDSGSKLSPIINNLLREWLKDQERMEQLKEEDEEDSEEDN